MIQTGLSCPLDQLPGAFHAPWLREAKKDRRCLCRAAETFQLNSRVLGPEDLCSKTWGSCSHSHPHTWRYIQNIMQRNKTKYEVVNESAAKAVLGLSCKLPRCLSALTLTSAPSAFLSFPQPVTRADCLLTLKQLRCQTHTFPGASEPSDGTLREVPYPSHYCLAPKKCVCVCGGGVTAPSSAKHRRAAPARSKPTPGNVPGVGAGSICAQFHARIASLFPNRECPTEKRCTDRVRPGAGVSLSLWWQPLPTQSPSTNASRIRSGSTGELPEPTTAQCTESWRRRSAPRSRR